VSQDLSKYVEILDRKPERHAQHYQRNDFVPANRPRGIAGRGDLLAALENFKNKTSFGPAKTREQSLSTHRNVLLTDKLPAALTKNNFTLYPDRHSGSPTRVVSDYMMTPVYNRQKDT
jgi:hypothetical protein